MRVPLYVLQKGWAEEQMTAYDRLPRALRDLLKEVCIPAQYAEDAYYVMFDRSVSATRQHLLDLARANGLPMP